MNLDRKMFNLVVLINLKKAFDTVDRNKRRSLNFAQILYSQTETRSAKLKIPFLQSDWLNTAYDKALSQDHYSFCYI
jgi:hypothetical protein